MTSPILSTVLTHTRRALGRHTRTSCVTLIATLAIALTACRSGDVTAPTPPNISASQKSSPLTEIEKFALAQGTFCDDATYLPCFPGIDLGYIYVNSEAFVRPKANSYSLLYTLDIGGANARWYARNNLAPAYPPYSITGSVKESRLDDGRRRLLITARARNTFTQIDNDFYDGSVEYAYSDRLLGADFFEYPGVDASRPDRLPNLADVDAYIDLILPADYVGYPDLVQASDFPPAGMELRRLLVNVEATGKLLSPYNSLGIGTPVRVRVRDDYFSYRDPSTYTPPEFTITKTGERKGNGQNGSHGRGKRLHWAPGSHFAPAGRP